jgi:hypothetical protein
MGIGNPQTNVNPHELDCQSAPTGLPIHTNQQTGLAIRTNWIGHPHEPDWPSARTGLPDCLST